jgi:hypothetical protein
MKNNKKIEERYIFDNIFPIIKNVHPKLLGDDIKGKTIEETRKTMKKMFNDFERKTSYKPIIVGNKLPTKVLFPLENIKSTDE